MEEQQDTDPLVKWHACLDLDPVPGAADQWEQADKATPKPSEDEGFFTQLQENLYRETDPAKTLEEQWASTTAANSELGECNGLQLFSREWNVS